jgi:hypothetical protein
LTAGCIGDNTIFITGQHYFGANKLLLETYTERGVIRPHSGGKMSAETQRERGQLDNMSICVITLHNTTI